MNSTILHDDRLHDFPRVVRHGEEIHLAATILTAAALTAALYLVWLPLRSVARGILFILGPWAGGAYMGYWSYPDLPFHWPVLMIAAVVVLAVWLSERALSFPLTRLLVGKRLLIVITSDEVRVTCGGFQRVFPRAQRLAFVHVPIPAAQSPVFRSSNALGIVAGDVKRTRIAECFGVHRLDRIVSNANVALGLAHQADDRDIDPIAQRLARSHR
jgi:hypothetical protein